MAKATDTRLEIERKFLVAASDFQPPGSGVLIRQAYIAERDFVSVRIRQSGDDYTLSVKSAIDMQQRHEVEVPVSEADARLLFAHCAAPGAISKRRYRCDAGDGLVWEIDVFEGENAGLVVAEIELPSADCAFARPDWLGEEITDDPRYLNTSLAQHPYTAWTDH
ncbi:MAG: CYTH domain-containing protein [Pseudomonadota bacterium]